ncbi:hypothetical protein ATANTOWER_026522 [Ataeniobius toweri]|uniref:Uncharacterized protein n=1 Tax=Ataeniobius toweri TaxID=208326 RepID=A0ABU7AU46_9TELE|nr:hypothetical protein [Ataeniobius toweri]
MTLPSLTDFALWPAPCRTDWILDNESVFCIWFIPQPAPCLTPLALELDPVSVHGFTPQPSHWFIQPEPDWLSNLAGIIVKRTITTLCVPATASADSPGDLVHILYWVPHLFPRLRRLVALLNSVQV